MHDVLVRTVATAAVLLFGLASAPPVDAQTYRYTARTAEPVRESGAVTASGLTWQCSGTACTISGPWATPGVTACAALAAKVGPITEYGHPKRKLSAQQLETCNAGLPDRPAVRLDPSTREQIRRKSQIRVRPDLRVPNTRVSQPSAPADPDAARSTGGPDLAIEEGSYRDYTLYVRVSDGVAFHGTYAGDYPPSAPDVPRVAWNGNTLRLPGLRHTGTDESAEAVLPAGSAPADRVVDIRPTGRFVEIPLTFEEIPQRVSKIQVGCDFSVIPSGTGVYAAGVWSAQNTIGFAEGDFWRRDTTDGDWRLSTTARLPIHLRHFMTPDDIRSTQCTARLFIQRTDGRGADQVLLPVAADPESSKYLAGMRPAPGSPVRHEVVVNVEKVEEGS